MKTYSHRDNMTNEMRTICDDFYDQDKLKAEYLEIQTKYNQVCDVLNRIKLPMKNEEGVSVTHGCRIQLTKIKTYYEVKKNHIEDFITDEIWLHEQWENFITYKRRG